MKRILPFALLLIVCAFMLLSCGLSATQIENNLKGQGYTTKKWTEDEAREAFVTLYDKEEYEITSVFEGSKEDGALIIVVQLTTSAQAKDFKNELKGLIDDEELRIVVEGRLVLIGYDEDVDLALGKDNNTSTSTQTEQSDA